MVSIAPDVGKNRLIIQLSGSPSSEEVSAAHEQLREAIARLKAPFDVVSDVRQLEELTERAAEAVRELGLVLRQAGVRHTVRVVGKSAQAAVTMERVARQINHAAHLAFSLEEADELLQAR